MFYLSIKQQKVIERSEKRYQFISNILTYLNILTTFAQFWLLTRIFPLNLLIIFLSANLLVLIIILLIGAITGFGLPEKQEKIEMLTLLWLVEKKQYGCLLQSLLVLTSLNIIIAPLWVFWSYPIADPKAVVLIAFFQFTVVQILVAILTIITNWSLITSPYIDDDIRNQKLTTGFAGIILVTIYMLFPVWIFEGNLAVVQDILGFKLPGIWFLISIPIVLFIFGSLVPFFVGMYRYQQQAKLMVIWRKNWLQETRSILNLPSNTNRKDEWNNKVNELQLEIRNKSESNELLKAFLKFHTEEQDDSFQNRLEIADHTESESQDNDKIDLLDKDSVKQAKDFVRGYFDLGHPTNQSLEWYYKKLESCKHKIVTLDLRFGYLNQLLSMLGIVSEGDNENIKGYLDSQVEELNNTNTKISSKKNWLAGIIISGLSSITIYLIKNYQDEILALISKAVNLK